MKTIEVVAAIIIFNEKVLCVQRGPNKYEYISYKYEFPGGKVEEGEKFEDALIREIKEELELEIQIQDFFLTVTHSYPNFNLIMHSFICTCDDSTLCLTEHINFKWLSKFELSELDWAAADLPIVKKLMK